MGWLLENRCLWFPHRFLDSAFGLARNDRFGVMNDPEVSRIPTTFILTVEAGKHEDDFDLFADRAQNRGWTVVEMEGTHNPQWYQPENFAEVLLRVIED